MKKTLLILFALTLAGCSSPYVYHVEPTQLQNNETQYNVNSVTVNLELGHGAIDGDESFASQDALQKQFKEALIVAMKEKGIYAADMKSGYAVNVSINYKRTFNSGGKSLNKPEVFHSVYITDDKKVKLASFANGAYTTNHGSFGEVAVKAQIATFNWGAEDEPKDVKVVAEVIVNQLADLGD